MTILVVSATAFIAPGIRHTHEGGSEHHFHEHSHGHSHSHHGHTHHDHSHHGHSHLRGSTEKSRSNSHLHLTFFGFRLILPDFSGDEDSVTDDSNTYACHPTSSGETSSDSIAVDVRPEFSITGLIGILALVESVLPERTRVPLSDFENRMVEREQFLRGLPRDMPLTPPPESV